MSTRIVDTHAHWYPPEWLALLERDGPKEGAGVERTAGGYVVRTPKMANSLQPAFVDLALRLAEMDRMGVQMHALSLTNPMVHWASPALGAALATSYNDAVSAAHLKHPRRLVGLAALPMQDPAAALKELERAAKLPGLRGLHLPTAVNGVELDDRRYWELYARAEALGWPIFLHPVETLGPERTKRFFLRNLLGNPYDTGVAAAHLIFGGVLDAFPRLEFSLPHAGGALLSVIGRLDHGAKVRAELRHMERPPSEYLRRFTYDCIGHSDAVNLHLIRTVGADRVLLGSDYCFDMGLDDPVAAVTRLEELDAAGREAILGGTAARLLALG